MKRLVLILCGATTGLGCTETTEESFIGSRRENLCRSAVGFCDTSADCILEPDEYISGAFPANRKFLVVTQGVADVSIQILFEGQQTAGRDTRIVWHEPDCASQKVYNSQGVDVFQKAGDDQIFEESRRMTQFGNHLIEISSDAFTDYLLRVRVESP